MSGLQEEKCGRDLSNVAGKHMTSVCDVATSRNPEKGRLIHLSFATCWAVIEGIARRVAKHMHHQRRDPRIDIGGRPAVPCPAPGACRLRLQLPDGLKDKTVWQYKAPTRNLSKEEAPNEERGHQRGRMNFNCHTSPQIKNDHALFASPAGHSTCSDVFCSRVCGIGD